MKAKLNEAPSTLRSGYLLPTLRRERNPSEAKNSSLSSTGLRPRYFAKGDKKIVAFVIVVLLLIALKSFAGKKESPVVLATVVKGIASLDTVSLSAAYQQALNTYKDSRVKKVLIV